MKPIYKIETYTDAQLDHTITAEAIKVYYKDILTNQIGNFDLWLPMTKGIADPYFYNDIAVKDLVKIWVDYDSLTENPQFVGKVQKIETILIRGEGYVRRISGLALGEILFRRFKRDKYYNGVGASTIVTEWATTDLGLGLIMDDPPDTTPVELTVQTKNYFDLLRWISDYWYSAESQIKKDFCVDIGNNLIWKSRPWRTEGVETLTVGTNIQDYTVIQNIEPVKNKIKVYGLNDRAYPTDKDSLTEQNNSETPEDDGWVCNGTLAWNALDMVGDESLQGLYENVWYITMENSLPNISSLDCSAKYKTSYTNLFFWINVITGDLSSNIKLLAPDASNYFRYTILETQLNNNEWFEFNLPLGPTASQWTPYGNPSWDNIQKIRWTVGDALANYNVLIDGFHFGGRCFEALVEDATSQSTYGIRELEVADDKLLSDSECQKRAETLLYQKKELPLQLEVTVKPGSNNLLIGDRLPMTIPAEGISAQDFDVLSVEQLITKSLGFTSKATMINTENIREAVPRQPIHKIFNLNRLIRQLNIDEKTIS